MFDALLPPAALLIEHRFGYPAVLFRLVRHPVMWIGALIAVLDTGLNRPYKTPEQRKEAGIVALLVILLVPLVAVIGVLLITRNIPFGWVVEAVIATAFLAQKDLGRAVRAVADALAMSLSGGRKAVSEIVGRDPEQLDEAGVARAAIETLAENASDGVIAPLFWLILLGLPGIVLYKAVNTADSMLGHLNERYRDFGWASAKFDDLVNWVPARLTAGLFVVACFFVRKASPSQAWKAMQRDAKKHASPNAGWPEAAMAGALGFALGGPRSYQGKVVDLPRMGDGRAALTAGDIIKALMLYDAMLWVALAVTLVQALMRL